MDPTIAGGSAFPLPLGTANCAEPNESGGMYLRDYFAAKALPEILAQKDVHRGSELENAAWIAYQMADAMLKARAA